MYGNSVERPEIILHKFRVSKALRACTLYRYPVPLTPSPLRRPFLTTMDAFDPTDFLKGNSTHSIYTMETDDVTNQSSSSDILGASLDMDRHGLARTNHLRTNQRGYHHRGGDSQDGFGESFMLEDSFALGESFSCYEDGGVLPESCRRLTRERPDISSVLVIEEDEEEKSLDPEEEKGKGESSMYELDRQAQKLTLKPQTSNISVEG